MFAFVLIVFLCLSLLVSFLAWFHIGVGFLTFAFGIVALFEECFEDDVKVKEKC